VKRRDKKREKGNTIMEFAICTLFVIPVLLGTFTLGMNLIRAVQVTQVCRDAGHMYVRQVDFSLDANKDIVVRLASGLGLQRTGGTGVVILSKITYIGDAQCTAAGLSGAACVNRYQNVITQRLLIGNSSARASSFGTPNSNLIGSNGDVANYLTQTSARATGFGSVLTLNAGELAFVSESYFPSPDYDMPGFSPSGVYARAIY
jgi:hypothetical protein